MAALQGCTQYDVGSAADSAPIDASQAESSPVDATQGEENHAGESAAPDATMAPGTVTASITNVTGSVGKFVTFRVLNRGVIFGTRFGARCDEVTTDPAAFNHVLLKPVTNSSDPCSVESVTATVPAGDYDLMVTITAKGASMPEKCVVTPFSVNGNVTVVVTSALGPCN